MYHNKKHNREWFTEELKLQSVHLKNVFWITVILKCPVHKKLYDDEKKKYRNNIKLAKQTYYNTKINNSSNKSRETWKIVNKILDRNKNGAKGGITLKVNDRIINDITELATVFAHHFSDTAPKIIEEHFGSNLSLPCTLNENHVNSIYFNPITVEEVHNFIVQLKNKNSTGYDGLTTKIVKNIENNILEPFVYLLNKSIEAGIFPNCLKLATVIPLLKKGDPTDLDNYRQISLLSVLSKIPERVVSNRISEFAEKNEILPLSQHGFRSIKSVETASYHLMEYVYKCLDEGKYVVSLFFDLSKAFDTVNKEILNSKLYSVGIRGNFLLWLTSYMENRSLRVRLSDQESDTFNVALGVPQGSVLGPLLFMLYVNDLPSYMEHGHVTMFADDTTITVLAVTLEELHIKINSIIESLSAWCQRNKLILNEKKTVCLNFHLQKTLPENFMINDFVLSDSVKSLGIFLDAKLSWCKHIDHVCSQLNKAFFAMLQLKSTLNKEGLINIYYAMAYRHISFNILAWGKVSKCKRVFYLSKKNY